MNAERIASYISAAQTEYNAGNLTPDQYGHISRSFWDLACALKLNAKVHTILNGPLLAEMNEAITKMFDKTAES